MTKALGILSGTSRDQRNMAKGISELVWFRCALIGIGLPSATTFLDMVARTSFAGCANVRGRRCGELMATLSNQKARLVKFMFGFLWQSASDLRHPASASHEIALQGPG